MLLQSVVSTLEDESTEKMEEVMKEWQQRKRGMSAYDSGVSGQGNDSNVTLPLSQGEWDEPLGLPLCVVCHGVSLSKCVQTSVSQIFPLPIIETKLKNLFKLG